MSRTKRRTNKPAPKWVTHDWDYPFGCTGGWVRIPLEGKVLQKALAKYHGDKDHNWNGPTKYYRNSVERHHRMTCKDLINKYYKDSEYEVQILNKPFLGYWD